MPRLNIKQRCLLSGLAVASLAALSCSGESNIFACAGGVKGLKCDSETQDEQAQSDLNNQDYSGAITIYQKLISSQPTDYARYPLLAAAYAAAGGIDILHAAQAQFSGGSSLLTAFSGLIPTPSSVGATAFSGDLTAVKAAVTTLHEIPPSLIASTSASPYAASADLQLTLYQTAYAIMYLDQFVLSASGQISTSQLGTISESDAETILSNLIAVGQIPQAAGNAALQANVNSTVAKIDAEPGATTQDKLDNFIASQTGSGTKS